MANADSRVTIHMAASLDGFIARKDRDVDWLETSDRTSPCGLIAFILSRVHSPIFDWRSEWP
jgi:hypothetical protein